MTFFSYFGGKSNCFDKFWPQLSLCRQTNSTFVWTRPHAFHEKDSFAKITTKLLETWMDGRLSSAVHCKIIVIILFFVFLNVFNNSIIENLTFWSDDASEIRKHARRGKIKNFSCSFYCCCLLFLSNIPSRSNNVHYWNKAQMMMMMKKTTIFS